MVNWCLTILHLEVEPEHLPARQHQLELLPVEVQHHLPEQVEVVEAALQGHQAQVSDILLQHSWLR